MGGTGGSDEPEPVEPIALFSGAKAPEAGIVEGEGPILPRAACEGAGTCPMLGEGHQGSGLCFDGVDDCLQVPWQQELNTTEELSVSAWLKPSAAGGGMSAVNKFYGPTTGDFNSWQMFLEPTHLSFRSWDGKRWDFLDTGDALPQDAWTHVVLTWNGANKRLYIDGELIGFVPGGMVFDQGDWYIGCELETGKRATYFAGCVDDVALYDRELNSSQVLRLAEP